ncbi:MAG: hypothetical protein SP1CHLAM54_11720 [Chlamydiia bacterium]|nr:hypothetical protein [Chlamydiia bacterium]MCH9616075.1 hypothetical protein [Chlamydiia bacterium]MCH9629098.1 hypothetical protein [Chlamydiia bacterium]
MFSNHASYLNRSSLLRSEALRLVVDRYFVSCLYSLFSQIKVFMKSLVALAVLWVMGVWGSGVDEYFAYLQVVDQEVGDHQAGEIEIILDEDEILRVQEIQKGRLLAKGFSEEMAESCSRVGVVFEDQYWLILRDAVLFPSGAFGTYNRLLWKSGLGNAATGVAVMPVWPSGEIVLNLNYRHATRSFELELPRGMMEDGESLEETVRRELFEETGLMASEVVSLGSVAIDTGTMGSVLPVFMAKISMQGDAAPEDSEAIAGVVSLTLADVRRGLAQGYLEVEVHGRVEQVAIRDPFLTFGLCQLDM